MKQEINKGTRVEFDSDHGPQKGTVIDVKRHIKNAQGFATVEVDHILPGCVWQVPLADLKREAVAA